MLKTVSISMVVIALALQAFGQTDGNHVTRTNVLKARLDQVGMKCDSVRILTNGFYSFGCKSAWGATFEREPTDKEIGDVARIVRSGIEHAIIYVRTNGMWGLSENGSRLSDLSPLAGLPIEALDVSSTSVSNIASLSKLPLYHLTLSGTLVTDLSPVRGMPLEHLDISSTEIRDISSLDGMKLKRLFFSPDRITNGFGAVRGMTTIELIGLNLCDCWPPDEFWKKHDTGEFDSRH